MFLQGRSKRRLQITVPPDDPSGADSGLGWDAMIRLSWDASTVACPNELDHFDDVAESFRADPGWILRRSLGAPVGGGVDLAMLTPYLMAIASYLFGIVSQSIGDKAVETLSQATRDRLRTVLRRREISAPDQTSPTDGESMNVTAAASIRRDAAHGAMHVGQVAVILDEQQEKEVFRLFIERAVALGLDEKRATVAAEAFIGALRLRINEAPIQ